MKKYERLMSNYDEVTGIVKNLTKVVADLRRMNRSNKADDCNELFFAISAILEARDELNNARQDIDKYAHVNAPRKTKTT
jgi:hypothetical protein